MISIIAAIGKNWELGYKNELLWHLKEDMKFFKNTTMGKTIVCGRKTYESIGRPLPNRKNIILSHNSGFNQNVQVVSNIEEIISLSRDNEIFIIGGAEVYKQFMPLADNIYLTHIDDEKMADTFFPKFNKKFYEAKTLINSSENGIGYKIIHYKKIA